MRGREVFSPAQCRAARGLLDWTTDRLADAVHLDGEAIELFEQGGGDLAPSELAALGAVLNHAGVIALAEGLAGPGVRFRARQSPDAHGVRMPFREAPAFDRWSPLRRAFNAFCLIRQALRSAFVSPTARGRA